MKIAKIQLEILIYISTVIFIGLLIYLGYTRGVSINNPWTIGDWLINYNSGFIRRGFLGELVTKTKYPSLMVFCIQISCYILITSFFVIALKKKNYPSEYVFLSITPFLFLFPILDPQGGFRKEILAFSIIALACCSKLYLNKEHRVNIFIAILAIYPFLVLTHEMLSIFLPIIIIFHLDLKLSKNNLIISGLLIGISFIAFLLSLKFSIASPSDILKICEPLANFCSSDINANGAISWLQYNSEFGYEKVNKVHGTPGSIIRYIISLLLLLPLVILIRKDLYSALGNKLGVVLFGIFTLALIVLHFVAIDYGRFIHMWFFSLVLLALSEAKVSKERTLKLTYGILYVLPYLPIWRLGHVGTFSMLI